jgi:hypothetical protein
MVLNDTAEYRQGLTEAQLAFYQAWCEKQRQR